MVNALPATITAVVVCTSAGAVDALGALLPAFPAATPWPIVVVVHLPANRESLLDTLFSKRCALPCRQPLDKEPVAPGIWFAPPDYHLLIESDGTFALSTEPPVNYSRPSADVLFESAAAAYGAGLVCVVLTGANDDGASGAKTVRSAGGFVVVQEPGTAEAASMPSAAILAATPQLVTTIESMAEMFKSAALEGAIR